MSEGFQFLDIVVLAMIAGFVALRLGSVLGRRTGDERRPNDPYGVDGRPKAQENGADLGAPQPASDENGILGAGIAVDSKLGQTLSGIMAADRSFDPSGFLGGASAAYAVILGAFASGDREALKELISPEVFADFDAAIAAREEAGQTFETRIVDLGTAAIGNASLDGTQAEIDVAFEAEIVSVLRDSEGRILEGNPSDVELVKNIWTFARDISDQDPNWRLIATETED